MKSFYAVAVLALIAVSAGLPAPEFDTTSPIATASDNRWYDCSQIAIDVEKECLKSDVAKVCQDHFNAAKALCDFTYPTSTS
ncbi:hypothetical protein CPB97_001725 [Podila verticillata]|nr:hypothetical protein CPB97_001725 [Podila verticillata]